ncbi:CheY chemotaxis protein or a CheY-like REC (receiver) domain [Devosia lucknowensis]|uniref:CheY chemotaxis protein or a CheY-like REC (Receiver) domain n=1 Tax=Devosia lucknowensis TaxID=1096929 RepID=A0A1Y6FC86_9HYPH|nr:response regulator [Devosia lucknowensis]SMQ70063.1 CheY chemotaxis protein or a CheY-like REC (receiver) domain [Devosia lucknowensis]
MPDNGRRIFVVEDESLVLLNLEDILADLGWSVAAQAMWLPQAERLAASVELPDAAILDVNIGGTQVFPAARILAERGVPILFATGYGKDGLPPEWQDRPVIVKPYTRQDVETALERLVPAAA